MKRGNKKKPVSLTEDVIEFVLEDQRRPSSPVATSPIKKKRKPKRPAVKKVLPTVTDSVLSPIARKLAEPQLPELARENRARLQMQSPERLFFYWSLKNNPYQLLNRALMSQTGSYTLVMRLVDLTRGSEELHPVEPVGTWWFAAEPDSEYRAEIGFYAPNRPFIRILYSNTVRTPRPGPSPRTAPTDDWGISADGFSRVLSAAEFHQDALDVAIAGDDPVRTDSTARSALSRVLGTNSDELVGIDPEGIRYVLLALAAGVSIEALRWRIGPALFALVQKYAARLNRDLAAAFAKDELGMEPDERVEQERYEAVYGASLVSFPRGLKKRRRQRKYSPISSF